MTTTLYIDRQYKMKPRMAPVQLYEESGQWLSELALYHDELKYFCEMLKHIDLSKGCPNVRKEVLLLASELEDIADKELPALTSRIRGHQQQLACEAGRWKNKEYFNTLHCNIALDELFFSLRMRDIKRCLFRLMSSYYELRLLKEAYHAGKIVSLSG